MTTTKPKKLTHAYAHRPSWKAYGKGQAYIELDYRPDGSLSIIASETPEGIRGGKEVMVALPPNKVEELKAMLTGPAN